MAKGAPKKKASSTGRNPERRNGKAWKKEKAPKPPRTPEAQIRYEFILEGRLRRRQANAARRIAEKAAAEELELMRQAEEEAARRHDPVGMAVKARRKKAHLIAA